MQSQSRFHLHFHNGRGRSTHLKILAVTLYYFIWEHTVQSHGLFLKLGCFLYFFFWFVVGIFGVGFMADKHLPLHMHFFIWLKVSFAMWKLFSFMRHIYWFLASFPEWWEFCSESPYPYLYLDMYSPTFSSRRFSFVEGLNPLEFIFFFVQGLSKSISR